MFRKAIAVTGIAAGILAAGAGAAFAQQPPDSSGGGLTINASVPITESIALTESNGSASLTPGNTTTVFPVDNFTTPNDGSGSLWVLFTTNDSAGYVGTLAETTPLAAGSVSIPDTDVSTAEYANPASFNTTWVPFNAAGQLPGNLVSSSMPSGDLNGGSSYFNDGASDALASNYQIATPANQAGGAYSGTFTYSIIGN